MNCTELTKAINVVSREVNNTNRRLTEENERLRKTIEKREDDYEKLKNVLSLYLDKLNQRADQINQLQGRERILRDLEDQIVELHLYAWSLEKKLYFLCSPQQSLVEFSNNLREHFDNNREDNGFNFFE